MSAPWGLGELSKGNRTNKRGLSALGLVALLWFGLLQGGKGTSVVVVPGERAEKNLFMGGKYGVSAAAFCAGLRTVAQGNLSPEEHPPALSLCSSDILARRGAAQGFCKPGRDVGTPHSLSGAFRMPGASVGQLPLESPRVSLGGVLLAPLPCQPALLLAVYSWGEQGLAARMWGGNHHLTSPKPHKHSSPVALACLDGWRRRKAADAAALLEPAGCVSKGC